MPNKAIAFKIKGIGTCVNFQPVLIQILKF